MPPIKRNRRKLGARHYKNYSKETMSAAIKAITSKKMSTYEAEKKFGIPRRTIEKKIKNQHNDKPGPPFKLDDEEELSFVKVLITAADYGAPLTQLDLRILVLEYLKRNNRADVFNNKLPSEWWARNFVERNREKLTVRAIQNIKRARAEKTIEEFQNYFANLECSLDNVPPSHIVNYDETNFSDDPGSPKCIFRRGVKYPERIMNSSKGCISIMFAATAEGTLLPPYIVYKAECLWTQWVEGGPDDARYNRTKSGWFDTAIFFNWFCNIIIPWARQLDGPKVVIGDNLTSHINMDVIELCEKYNIRFVLLPTNSTHLTQPLDVAFFGSLKKTWRKILTQYKIENPRQASLNKAHFPPLLKTVIDDVNMNKRENIVQGFKATGIYPFNPQKIYRKLPDCNEEVYSVDKALLDYLKESRKPKEIKRKTNKKLNIQAGQSITTLDLIQKGVNEEESKKASKKPGLQNKKINKNSTTNTKTPINKKTTVKRTLKKAKTHLTKEHDSKLEQKDKAQISSEKSNKDDIKQEPVKRKKRRVESSSDSESSFTIPSSDSSEYDPRNDEDTEIGCDINESIKVGIDYEKSLEDQHVNGGNVEIVDSIERDKDRKVQILKEKKDEVLENQETNLEVTGDLYSKNNSKDQNKVKILSDIRNTAENRAYFDLRKYGPLALEEIKTDHILVNVKCKKENKNIESCKINKIHSRSTRMTKVPSHTVTSNTDLGGGCSKEAEQYTTSISYNVNDYVLVRYILKKKIQYFVGKVIVKLGDKYQVSFFKRTGRNDSTKFTLPKKEDIDTIDEGMIVKEVQLLSLSEKETEFVFFEDDDLLYFD